MKTGGGAGTDPEHEATITIGALARASGVPVQTIRTWETRYGVPRSRRKPSGHRIYPVSAVGHLRRIAGALARGVRAAEAVRATDAQLDRMLALREPEGAAAPGPPGPDPAELLALVARFDGEALTRHLLADAARMGPVPFAQVRVAPLLRAVGEAWAGGTLEVRHEHFLSEKVGDVLRTLRLAWDERAAGPVAALGTLPGETHVLGLQLVALVLAAAGWRVVFAGAEVPVAELPRLAHDTRADVLAISVSVASAGPRATAALTRLARRLPGEVALLVGGEGAPAALPGATVMKDLTAVFAWARSRAT